MAQHRISRRRFVGSGILVGTLAALTVSAPTASMAAPAPVPPAVVASTASGGMVYTGSSASTITRISLSGTTFTVDDDRPITASFGCFPVPGDVTQARCNAPKDTTGKFKLFKVNAKDGNDTVFNVTPVGMIADGGIGNDSLNGSVTAGDVLSGSVNITGVVDSDKLVGNGGNDTLKGGTGNDLLDGGLGDDSLFGGADDDQLKGGAGDDEFFASSLGGGRDGNDTIDGGPGLGDRVDYTNYTTGDGIRVVINLQGSGLSGVTGVGPNEKDEISDVENADGSLTLENVIFGNQSDNRLLGGTENDVILGDLGADFVVGGEGNDLLSSNSISLVENVPVTDGARDRVLGGFDTDTCVVSPQDNDFTSSCEKVLTS